MASPAPTTGPTTTSSTGPTTGPTTAGSVTRPGRLALPRPVGFAAVAALLVALLAASAAPSPLYPVWQQRFGAPPAALTAVFAVYALVLLAALAVAGRLSDHVGRRPVLLAALAVEVVAMALFATAHSTGALLLARAVQGLATGAAIGTAGAALLDLAPRRRPALGATTNSVAPPAGLAVGALGAGALVEHAPDPDALVFWLLAALFVLGAAAVAVLPETAPRRPGALASLRPRLAVPAPVRRPFTAAAPAFVATWAMGALYLSLGPAVAARTAGSDDHLVAGALVALFPAAGALASALAGRLGAVRLVAAGSAALAAGTAVALLGAHASSTAAFAAGTAVAGAGFGTAFLGGLRRVVAAATPDDRAGVLTAVYLVSYLAFSVPALVAGALVPVAGLLAVATGYGALVVALSLAALAAALRRSPADPRPRPEVGTGGHRDARSGTGAGTGAVDPSCPRAGRRA